VSSVTGTLAPPDPQTGLSSAEAGRRRAAGLGNAYRTPSSRTYWEILRDHSYPLINGPLLAISALLVAFGLLVEALLTAGPVLTNIAIGVVQGTRAKRQLDRVALLTRPRATVLRDGMERQVDPAELVVGDIVIARRGDQILVDGRVVGGRSARVDESPLTGESEPIEKRVGDSVLSGGAVISGTMSYLAEAVGRDMFANRILAEAKGRRDVVTPLQRDVARAIGGVGVLVLLSAVLVALAPNPADGAGVRSTIVDAAVLVTLVPQGLALMLTVTYAAAAIRNSRLGVLAQRQSAIEAMSRIDVFCTDKTGTLTTQRIDFGRLEVVDPSVDPDAVGRAAGAYGASTASPNETSRALAAAFHGEHHSVAAEVEFSSSARWSAIRFGSGGPSAQSTDLAGSTFVLGAAEVVLPAAAHATDGLERRAESLAAAGERVLVLALGSELSDEIDGQPRLPSRLRPLAFLTFTEQLRPTARTTLDGFRARGIEVKVVSGDEPRTVTALGRRLGLASGERAPSGLDVAALDDDELGRVADETRIFGRVDPHLKARLVRALQARGHTVAMTGDGVNDILPVRSADVGIAMQSGSPATRGVADLVLLRDDFAVLPEAIRDGQRIVAAMTATLVVLLARTFYVLLIVIGAALLALPFPLTPRQNSILAFVTVGVPIIVLALWVEARPVRGSLLGQTLRVSIPVSLGVAVVALPIYAAAVLGGAPVDVARTILTTAASFMGIGLLILIPLANDVSGRLRLPPWGRTGLLMGAMAVVYVVILSVPFGRDFFELEPLPAPLVLGLGLIAAVWTMVVLLIRRNGIVQRIIDRLLGAYRAARRRMDG
jgi:cation-transporting ATPase E